MASLELEHAACAGCAADDGELVYRAADVYYGVVPEALPIVRCRACGLVYLAERPTRAAIAAAYPPTYFWRQARVRPRPGGGLDEWLVAAYFRQLYARRARAALAHLPAAAPRVLDLGAGEGHFLTALAARRPGDYLGVDFEAGRAPPGVRLRAADLNALALDEPPFDLVAFWHVLEHLHDPPATLARAVEAVKPGGVLLIATQNFDALSRHLMGPRWPLNDVPRHLVHFTPRTLAALVRAAGLQVVRVEHLTDGFPALGGHLVARHVARPDGTLRAWPGLLAAGLGAPLELLAIAASRGCTFTLVARRG